MQSLLRRVSLACVITSFTGKHHYFAIKKGFLHVLLVEAGRKFVTDGKSISNQ